MIAAKNPDFTAKRLSELDRPALIKALTDADYDNAALAHADTEDSGATLP